VTLVWSSCEYRCCVFCVIEVETNSMPQNSALNMKLTELFVFKKKKKTPVFSVGKVHTVANAQKISEKRG